MKENIAREKALCFSVRIVNLHRYLRKEKKEFTLSDQVLRSGTSIGANISEAQFALSERDMLVKLQIALKEAAETMYWLELLYRTGYIEEKAYFSLYANCFELKKILAASTNTLSKKAN